MNARRASNAAEQRAEWSREGKSATFLLEISGASDGANGLVSNGEVGRTVATSGDIGSRGSSRQKPVDVAITRLTFNEAVTTNKLLREARLDAVAAARKRGAGSLHGWLDALAMSSEANHAIKKVQSVFRGYHFRCLFRNGRRSVLRLQSWLWGRKARARVFVIREKWRAAMGTYFILFLLIFGNNLKKNLRNLTLFFGLFSLFFFSLFFFLFLSLFILFHTHHAHTHNTRAHTHTHTTHARTHMHTHSHPSTRPRRLNPTLLELRDNETCCSSSSNQLSWLHVSDGAKKTQVRKRTQTKNCSSMENTMLNTSASCSKRCQLQEDAT
jgi:hypothetical protein